MKTNVKYNNDTHEYLLDGKKVPSVTELASEYARLNKEWLAAHPEYAARGTIVHAELAEYLQGNIAKDELKQDLSCEIAEHIEPNKNFNIETIVYNTTHGYVGTADILAIKGLTVYHVIDIKTGRSRNKLYEQCQLSLYALALQDMGYNIDDVKLSVLCPDGYVPYTLLSWEQMQQLQEGDLNPDHEFIEDIQRKIERLKMLEVFAAEHDELAAELRAKLAEQFAAKNATTFVCSDYRFTYSKPSVRKSVDTTALKKDGLYEKYTKETAVAGSVKITKRKNDDDK